MHAQIGWNRVLYQKTKIKLAFTEISASKCDQFEPK